MRTKLWGGGAEVSGRKRESIDSKCQCSDFAIIFIIHVTDRFTVKGVVTCSSNETLDAALLLYGKTFCFE